MSIARVWPARVLGYARLTQNLAMISSTLLEPAPARAADLPAAALVEPQPQAVGCFIRGVGTATPPQRYSKAECLTAFERSDWFNRLDARSHFIARSVLQRDNGIDYRRLAVDSLDDVFQIDPDTLAQRFVATAPVLASDAGRRALADAGLKPADIGAVVVSTCTGYLCPGLSSYVVERLGLRADVKAFDLVGQGCGAALPEHAARPRTARLEHRRARAVDLCRGQQRRDVSGRRPRRAGQCVPVR